MTKTQIKKLKLTERLRDELHQDVWEVILKYIKYKNLRFNGPDTWEVCGDVVVVTGTDGCRGCYDSESCDIPLKWFEDFDKAVEENEEILRQQKEEEAAIKKHRKRELEAEKIEKEKQLFEELKLKYGN